MNKFIQAIKDLDVSRVKEFLRTDRNWINWREENGKNALHYLCGIDVSKDPLKAEPGLQILTMLLKDGMDIDAVHRIVDNGCIFPATPLWYAYTRGRNTRVFTHLLKKGAKPDNCMFAIAWYDDIESAKLFKKYGAAIDDGISGNTPFLSAFNWKRFNITQWFLEQGANVNFGDPLGNTALYYAVKRKYIIEHIQLLLNHGANYNQKNKAGISPIELAEINRQRKILNLFNTGQ